MNTAKYIGRVGALAVALGVGIALAGTPAVAFADPTDSGVSASDPSEPDSPGPDSSGSDSPRTGGANSADPTSQIRSALTDALNRDQSRAPRSPSGAAATHRSGGAYASLTALRRPAAAAQRHSGNRTVPSAPGVDDSTQPAQDETAPATALRSTETVSRVISTVVSAVANPSAATTAPNTPVPTPAPWVLAAFARREFEKDTAVSLRKPAATPGTPASLAVLPAEPRSTVTAAATGQPSATSQAVTATLRALRAFEPGLGIDLVETVYQLASSDTPPRLTTFGLNVKRSEFNGWTVWELAPANPSGKYVVAIHGGGYVLKPSTVLEWPNFAAMARNTGATVIVPIYPLAPQGTAATVVPQMADLIVHEIDQHGAENVSVYGISAGGGIAFTSVQELVRRGDPVPSHMVLISPSLDFTLSNPGIPLIDDPLVSASLIRKGQKWAGDLDFNDPLVSPLYGSMEGLPPTVVYAGTVDVVYPDVLVLQDKASATPGADFTFIIGEGQLHAWPMLAILPEARAAVRDIYGQLGLD